jgi:hypothetical protein
MAPIPPSAFEHRVATLGPDARASFVAAVYAARGAETRVAGDRVLVERAGGRDADGTDVWSLWVARTGLLGRTRSVPTDVDGVVTAGVSRAPAVPEGVETVDAERLRTTILYGLDRADARRLLTRHLDCSPTGWDAGPEHRPEATLDRAAPASRGRPGVRADRPTPAEGVAAGTTVDEPGRRGVAAVAVLGLVVALVVAPASPLALVPLGQGAAGPGGGGSVEAGVGAEAGVGDDTGAASTGADAGPVGATDGTADEGATGNRSLTLAPGVTVRGVERSSLLAEAHSRSVRNRSYVLEVSASEYAGQLQMAYRGAEVRMGEPDPPASYRADVVEWGEFRSNPGPVPDESVYANGSRELVRVPNGTAVRPVTSTHAAGPEYAHWAATLVYWYLSVSNTTIREEWTANGTTYYAVAGSDIPYPGVENATTRAVFDAEGVVHALEHSHEAPDSQRRVYVSMRYEFTEPTVSAPAWAAEASDPTRNMGVPVSNATTAVGESATGAAVSVREGNDGTFDLGRSQLAFERTFANASETGTGTDVAARASGPSTTPGRPTGPVATPRPP